MLNIYNPLNNIKFTNKKKVKKMEKKKFLVFDLLKVKYHTKRKRKRKDKSLCSPHSKY